MIPITIVDGPQTRIGSNLVTEMLAILDEWGVFGVGPNIVVVFAYGLSLGQFTIRLLAHPRIVEAWREGSQLGRLSQLLISMAVADV